MSIEILAIFSIVIFFASIVHSSIGFGLLMVATPIFALFTDIQTAIIYLLIPTLLINIVSILSGGNFFLAIKRFSLLALLASIGTAIGTQILILYPTEFFKVLLAFIIFFYLFSDKLNINYSWVIKKPKTSLVSLGLGAGLLSGLTNVMAPFLIIYSLESKHSKNELIQLSNVCFLFGKVIQILIFYINDKLTYNEVLDSSIMIPMVLIGFLVGVKIKDKINASNYKKIIRYLLIIIASSLIFQVLT